MKFPAEACFGRVRSRARTFEDLVPVRLAAAVPGVLVEVPGPVEGRVHGADDDRNNRDRHTQPADDGRYGIVKELIRVVEMHRSDHLRRHEWDGGRSSNLGAEASHLFAGNAVVR